jgi:glutamate/aspartate transport system substrate-binding protein
MNAAIAVFIAGLLAAGAVHGQPFEGRLKKIADTKTIAIAYRADAIPFSFANDKGEVQGFSIDLCKRVVGSIERQLKVDALKVNWVPVTAQSRFDAVAKGRADLECGSSTITLTRLRQVDFSSITFAESTGLLVKTASGARSLSDLSGKRIVVIKGTTNERVIAEQLKRRDLNAAVLPVATREEAMDALEEGKAEAFASDRLLLIGAASKAKDAGALTLLADQLSYEPYGIVLPRGDAGLRLAVNGALARLYASGEIVDIFRRWFGNIGKPSAVLEAVYILGAIPE